MTVAIAACTAPALPARPDFLAPDHFVEGGTTVDGVPGQDNSVTANAGWWQGFGSPVLVSLLAQARRDNRDIAADTAAIVAADAAIRVAGGALLPSLNADGTANRQQAAGVKKNTTRLYSTFSGSLNASYTLDLWGKNRNLVAAAEQTALATRLQRDSLIIATEASVADTWFTILNQQDRLRVANRSVAVAERVLAVIRGRQAVGTATALDLAQQENVLATQRASVPAIQQALAVNRHALALLVGQLPGDLIPLSGSLDGLTAPTVQAGLPSLLLKRRPDIRAVEAQLAASAATIAAARTALYPNIALTGSGGWSSTALNTLLYPPSVVASLGASLTQPLFDGGVAAATLEQNQANGGQLLATYHKTILTAFRDVEDGLVGVVDATEQKRLQEVVVETATRSLRIAEGQLREGTVDITSVLNAQTALFNAELALADDRLAALKASVALYQALGGGWSGFVDESVKP